MWSAQSKQVLRRCEVAIGFPFFSSASYTPGACRHSRGGEPRHQEGPLGSPERIPESGRREERAAQESGGWLGCMRYFVGTASRRFVQCTTPCSSLQRYSRLWCAGDPLLDVGCSPGDAPGGAGGAAGGGGGGGGGFGIHSHEYGVVIPSPLSSYRPFGYCTTPRLGATEMFPLAGGP
jgi:hypothetical protein